MSRPKSRRTSQSLRASISGSVRVCRALSVASVATNSGRIYCSFHRPALPPRVGGRFPGMGIWHLRSIMSFRTKQTLSAFCTFKFEVSQLVTVPRSFAFPGQTATGWPCFKARPDFLASTFPRGCSLTRPFELRVIRATVLSSNNGLRCEYAVCYFQLFYFYLLDATRSRGERLEAPRK